MDDSQKEKPIQGKFNLDQPREIIPNPEHTVVGAVDVIRKQEEIFAALVELFKLTKIKDPNDRNTAYVKQATKLLVAPMWGEYLNMRVEDIFEYDPEEFKMLNKIDPNRANSFIEGNSIAMSANDFKFSNSVAMGQNPFRLTHEGEFYGDLIIGDFALYGQGDRARLSAITPAEKHLIENSLVFGNSVLTHTRQSSIRNSIVAGHEALMNAEGTELTNVYVVSDGVIRYARSNRLMRGSVVKLPKIKDL